MTRLLCSMTLAFGLCAFPALHAQEAERATQPDNTKVNKRDRNSGAVTADQQKMNKTDRELAKEIRSAVVGDKSLSTYAHNVKIIARNGTVTLKGPVHTEEEKRSIVAKATDVAGAANVKDELTVKGDAKAK